MTVELGEAKVPLQGIAPRLIGAEEAARALGIGRSGIFLLMQSGALPSCKLGRRRLIKVSDLDEYVERLQAEA